jgi:hypothetical protein
MRNQWQTAWANAHPDLVANYRKEWQKRNPEKRRAQNAINNALRDGKITKPENCQKCGSDGRIEAHHPDYSKPLEVAWLCNRDHVAAHRGAE